MTYRLIDSEIWADSWFEEIEPEAKLLFIYLFTNNNCNQAGVMQFSVKRLAFDTGLSQEKVQNYLDVFVDSKKIIIEANRLACISFMKHQIRNGNFRVGCLKHLSLLPEGTLKQELMKIEATPKQPQSNPEETQKKPQSNPEETVSNAETVLKQYLNSNKEKAISSENENQFPDSCNSQNSENPAQRIPVQAIINIYASTLPELPQVRVVSEDIKKNLKARWNQNKEYQNLNFWTEFFSQVKRSDFLTGKKSEFRATFQWLVLPTNFSKVLNGQYENMEQVKQNGGLVL